MTQTSQVRQEGCEDREEHTHQSRSAPRRTTRNAARRYFATAIIGVAWRFKAEQD